MKLVVAEMAAKYSQKHRMLWAAGITAYDRVVWYIHCIMQPLSSCFFLDDIQHKALHIIKIRIDPWHFGDIKANSAPADSALILF